MQQATALIRAVNAKRANLTGTLARTRRDDGLVAAVRVFARWVVEGTAQPVTDLRRHVRDRRRGVDTGRERTAGAELSTAAHHADGTVYTPVPSRRFIRLLRRLPIGDPAGYAFVDYGCGKGATLLLAAEYGFGSVVGVELDSRLTAVARDNVRSVAHRSPRQAAVIEVVHADAAAHRPESRPTVAFLFNPFGADTLRAVLAATAGSLSPSAEPLVVAYLNPVHRHVLDECGWLRCLWRNDREAVYAAEWGFPV